MHEVFARGCVEPGAKRRGPQAGDTGFGNILEMCRNESTELFQQTFIEQELAQGAEGAWDAGPSDGLHSHCVRR